MGCSPQAAPHGRGGVRDAGAEAGPWDADGPCGGGQDDAGCSEQTGGTPAPGLPPCRHARGHVPEPQGTPAPQRALV